MKKFLPAVTTALVIYACGPQVSHADPTVDNITDGSPYYYTGAADDPITNGVGGKGTTDSGINHLPVYHGHMQTNNTYRFFNVAEQVLTMIGDGKHGLWRIQENGTIREYITDEAEASGDGLDDGASVDDPANLSTLEDYYTHYDESASFGGYKSVAGYQGTPVNTDGHKTFVDLPIFHPKYGGKYDDYPAIDLASYYCTMSGPSYDKARDLLDFAFAQPGTGHDNIGPLGTRAGLGISENYTKIMRLQTFPDAKIWANTKNREEALWQEIDTSKTKTEIYLVERPFFNEDYIFLVVVFDDKGKRGNHSYVRPDGAYYDHLVERGLKGTFSTKLKQRPKFYVLAETDHDSSSSDNHSHATGEYHRHDSSVRHYHGSSDAHYVNKYGPYESRKTRKKRRVDGFPVYGVHHPGGLTVANGACPGMGGDFGESYYGAAWPTNYQEVTPLCDGIVIDIKLYTNLDGVDWDNERKNLANNVGSVNGDGTTLSAGDLVKNYTTVPGTYGDFSAANTDPYMAINGIVNHEEYTTDGYEEVKYPSSNDQVEVNE